MTKGRNRVSAESDATLAEDRELSSTTDGVAPYAVTTSKGISPHEVISAREKTTARKPKWLPSGWQSEDWPNADTPRDFYDWLSPSLAALNRLHPNRRSKPVDESRLARELAGDLPALVNVVASKWPKRAKPFKTKPPLPRSLSTIGDVIDYATRVLSWFEAAIESDGGTVGRRGRRTEYDPASDAKLLKDWQATSAKGTQKKEFVREKGIPLREFDRMLARARMARKRKNDGAK